ncbi:MAG: hypothetical protein ACFFBV_05525, partial [Promethearchaeota archaeon]
WILSPGEGTKIVFYEIRDNAGLITQFNDTIDLDMTGPTGSIEINGGDTWTNSTSVLLSSVYADMASGVDKVRYSNNGTTWTPWETANDTRSWILSPGEGTKIVFYEIRDNAGLITQYNDTIGLDTMNPEAPINLSATPSTWTNIDNFTLSWVNPLDMSGIFGAYYKLDALPNNNTDGNYKPGVNITSITGIIVGSDGAHAIYVWLKDDAGNVNYTNYEFIQVYLDTTKPIIIDNQEGDDVWRNLNTGPGTLYDVDFFDSNPSYSLDYAQYIITTTLSQGGTIVKNWTYIFIDLGLTNYTNNWSIDFSMCQEGINYVSVRVYDKTGNVAILNDTFYVKKDTIAPKITIYNPKPGELFGIPSPPINISIYDDHLDFVWYELDNGTPPNPTREWTDSIYQEDWDQMGNGTVTLRFIAYDLANNINITTLPLRKNIHDPIIIITDPLDNELVGRVPPNIKLYNSSAAIDTIWYRIYNSTFSTLNITWDGSINMSAWDVFGNGTLSIMFYINDTLGSVGFDYVKLKKDLIIPNIDISNPKPFKLFGATPPNVSVNYFDDNSISSISYQLQNFPQNFSTQFRSWTESINLSDWNEMINGTVTIIFRAEDIVGNLAFANVTVRKDIIAPDIILYYPPYNGTLYSHERPWVSFVVQEGSGIANVSYQLKNATFSSPIREWNNSIDQNLWDDFGNGTITIYIYASDIVGNNGNASVIVRKDIIWPSIIIKSPSPYEKFGRDSPFFEVNITDGNLDTSWYIILGTNKEIPFTGPFGRIDQELWEFVWDNTTMNGIITIQFYANDTKGNENFVDLHLIKYQPTSVFTISNPLGLIFSTFGLMIMVPITVKLIKSRYYQNLNKKEKGKLKKVLIAAFILLSITVLFYIF